jgi:hypothetical protein
MTPADAAIDPPDSASRGTRGGIEHGLPGDADLVLRLQSSQAASSSVTCCISTTRSARSRDEVVVGFGESVGRCRRSGSCRRKE